MLCGLESVLDQARSLSDVIATLPPAGGSIRATV